MPRAKAGVISKARKIVYARDGYRCVMCGRSVVDYPSSVHHRRPRGAGGSALLERPSNLVRLCGDGVRGCHGWLESHRETANLTGWLLPKLNLEIDPTEVPLLTYNGWVLLSDDGSVTPCEAPQEVPA